MMPEPNELARRLLDSLTARVQLVGPELRRRISALSDRTPQEEIEEIASGVVNVVVLFGGADASKLLREIDAATGETLALAPRDVLVAIEKEGSVVEARRQAGIIAMKVGFRAVQRTKIVTATSELARNIHMYAGRGEIEIHVVSAPRPGIRLRASDHGPGIPNVDEVLAGRASSKRGMGLGLRGVKAMSDDFTITTAPGRGTSVSALFCVPQA